MENEIKLNDVLERLYEINVLALASTESKNARRMALITEMYDAFGRNTLKLPLDRRDIKNDRHVDMEKKSPPPLACLCKNQEDLSM